MLRYFFIFFALLIVVVVSMAGFRGQFFDRPPIEIFPDMDHQPKVKAQVPSKFFADNRGNRLPVPGTVPVGYSIPLRDQATGEIVEMGGPYKQIAFSNAPDYYNTGKIGDRWGTGLPIEVTMEVMARGRERYNISCKVCHGAVGLGNGLATQYGLAAVANLQLERFRTMADGEIFNTITHGKNTMMGYGHNIQVEDRWAIIAYMRALQRAQNASTDDVPPAELTKLQQQTVQEEATLEAEGDSLPPATETSPAS
jgi:mono/diheme cytochrome c family protein